MKDNLKIKTANFFWSCFHSLLLHFAENFDSNPLKTAEVQIKNSLLEMSEKMTFYITRLCSINLIFIFLYLQDMYLHPDSPNFGSHWMKDIISFSKVKLTNKAITSPGHSTGHVCIIIKDMLLFR